MTSEGVCDHDQFKSPITRDNPSKYSHRK